MEHLEAGIQKMCTQEAHRFPEALHGRIMTRIRRAILLYRLSVTVFIVASIQFFIGGWGLVRELIERDSFSFIQTSFSVFEFDFEYLKELGSMTFEFIPATHLAFFCLDVLVCIVLYTLFLRNPGRREVF